MASIGAIIRKILPWAWAKVTSLFRGNGSQTNNNEFKPTININLGPQAPTSPTETPHSPGASPAHSQSNTQANAGVEQHPVTTAVETSVRTIEPSAAVSRETFRPASGDPSEPSRWLRLKLVQARWACSTSDEIAGDGWWLVAAAHRESHDVLAFAIRSIATDLLDIRGWMLEGETYYFGTWTDTDWKRTLNKASSTFSAFPDRFTSLIKSGHVQDITIEQVVSPLR